MDASITQSWIRIENWLADKAPATFAALEPPASNAEIRAAERAVGLEFPAPLAESLRRHAGTGDAELIPTFSLINPAKISSEWQLMTRIAGRTATADEGSPGVARDPEDDDHWWHPQWIPIGADGGGDGLVIDQRANGHTGRVGERFKVDGGVFHRDPAWRSLPALLAHIAHCLETGEKFDGDTAVVEDGLLCWD